MSTHILLQKVLTLGEIALTTGLLSAITLRGSKLFPRTRLYLAIKLVALLVLFPLSFIQLQHYSSSVTYTVQYKLLFACYWTMFLLLACAMFLMISELFWLAVEPLPGLRRLGMLVFKWIAAVSAIFVVAFSASPRVFDPNFLQELAQNVQRCSAVLELCLVAFLYVIGRPLGMSLRSRVHGLGLGIGILCFSDVFFSGWFIQNTTLFSTFQIFHEIAPTMALAVWLYFFVTPEPARVPLIVPIKSPLVRWNEIAQSLGKKGGSVLLTHQREFIQKDMEALNKTLAAVRAGERA